MATERFVVALCASLVAVGGLSGCATVKEKTAPCKRPATLTAFANDPRQECGAMRLVLAPDTRFARLMGD